MSCDRLDLINAFKDTVVRGGVVRELLTKFVLAAGQPIEVSNFTSVALIPPTAGPLSAVYLGPANGHRQGFLRDDDAHQLPASGHSGVNQVPLQHQRVLSMQRTVPAGSGAVAAGVSLRSGGQSGEAEMSGASPRPLDSSGEPASLPWSTNAAIRAQGRAPGLGWFKEYPTGMSQSDFRVRSLEESSHSAGFRADQ